MKRSRLEDIGINGENLPHEVIVYESNLLDRIRSNLSRIYRGIFYDSIEWGVTITVKKSGEGYSFDLEYTGDGPISLDTVAELQHFARKTFEEARKKDPTKEKISFENTLKQSRFDPLGLIRLSKFLYGKKE